MQLLKYLFYLLGLTLVSVSVYILTLEKQFNIKDHFNVNVKDVYTRNYINDLQNWKEIIPFQHMDTTNSKLEKFSVSNDRVSISLDSTNTNNSLFSVYLSGQKIGDLTYTFKDSLKGSITNVEAKFIGEVTFLDKISIFLKGISPNYYFTKVFTEVNDNIQQQINADFSFKNFNPIKIEKIPAQYFYKSRYADSILSREKIMKDYEDIKKQLSQINVLNNSFYINIIKDTPKRKEYFIGIPVKNKTEKVIGVDIFLDSIPSGKVIKSSFEGNIAFENQYKKAVNKEILEKEYQIDPTKTLKVWNDDLKFSNPKKWKFETWYYFKTEEKIIVPRRVVKDSLSKNIPIALPVQSQNQEVEN